MPTSIKTGGGSAKFEGTATASQVLNGATFYSSDKEIKTGTMTNRGAVSQALNCGGSYTIPKGYHDGNGKVTANSLASQTDGTATAAQIIKGVTAYVNGTKLTGTMPYVGANAQSSDGATHRNTSGVVYGPYSTDSTSTNYLYFKADSGSYLNNVQYYRSPASTVASILGITANKIASGNTICGVRGTCLVGNEYVKRIFTQTVSVTAVGGSSQTFTLDYSVDTTKCIFLGEYLTQGSNNIRYSSMTSTTVTLTNWANSTKSATFTIIEFTDKFKSVDKGLSLTATYNSTSRTFSGVATGKFIAFCHMTGYGDKASVAILDSIYDANDMRCLTRSGADGRAKIAQSDTNLTLTVGGNSSYIYIHYYFVYFN